MDSVNSTLESLTTLVGDSEISSDDITRLREIGRGNFGVVYEGLCQRKQVAVKDIPCSLSSGVLEDVRQEVKINLALRHPNVVLTIGACTTVPGKVTIVSEFMKTDLKKLILEGKEIVPFLKRMRMCRDAAAGILWLHTRNPPIVHRDIKLDNFLVGDNDVVKVCDFGLSQVKVAPTLVDKKGRGRGTPIWMAPEVLSGKPLTEKADVYSFGLLIWSMVTCREYFTSIRTYEELYDKVVVKGVRPAIPSDIPKSLADLICACWAGDPAARPPFQVIVDTLDKVICELEIPSPSAREWWTRSFGATAVRVPWSPFVNAFCHDFSIVASNILVEDVMLSPNPQCVTVAKYLTCFRALIVDKDNEDEVVVEKFGEAVAWLGDIPKHARRIIVVAAKLLGQKYFFGDISKEESERLLNGKPPGTFLVRFSTTSLGGYTVSRVTREYAIMHVRLKHHPGALEYGYGSCVAKSLPEIIEVISKTLSLEFPCSGWPFSYLFDEGRTAPGVYGYENEDCELAEDDGDIGDDDDDDDEMK